MYCVLVKAQDLKSLLVNFIAQQELLYMWP